MSDKEKKPEEEEKPKGGGSKLGLVALLIGVLNLGGIGFVGFKIMTMPPPTVVTQQAEPPPAAKVPGPLAQLDPFVVNLDEPGTPRYLKTTVSLELTTEEAKTQVDAGKHQVRDSFLRYLSSLRVEDTRGEEGKTQIRNELLKRAQEKLDDIRVKNLFFGEFVVQ